MFPGSLAGAAGAGVRALEKPSGVASSYTATGTDKDTCANTSAAAGWVGRIVEFTDVATVATNGDNIKHQAVIVNVSAGTSFEFWPPTPENIESGDTFCVYESPLPYMVDTAGAAATTITDASMTGWADDEPNGYYAWCIYAAGSIAVGEMKQITDFVNSTGVATTAAFSASVAAGDFFLICKPLAVEEPSWDTPQTMITRDTVRDSSAPDLDYPAERRPSVGFKVPLKGIGDGVGNAETWASKAKGASQLLLREMFGTFTEDTGCAIEATSTTTLVKTTDGTGSYTAGNALLVNGDMAVIGTVDVSGDPDVASLAVASGGGPLLSAAPVAADIAYAAASARIAQDGTQFPTSFMYFRDQVLQMAFCCSGNATVEASPNMRLMLSLNYGECQYWGVQDTQIPATLDDSHYPELDVSDIRVANGRVLFASTAMELTDVSVDFGIDVQPRPDPNAVEGNRGGFVLPGTSTATLSGFPMENKTPYDRVDQTVLTGQMMLQFGKVPGNVVGIVFPRAQMIAASASRGPINRYDITVKATRPDENDPLGDAARIFWA
jgi:hypothetical protein